MSDIVWQDPPEDARKQNGSELYVEVRDQLRANPGRWAVIYEGPSPSLVARAKKSVAWRGFDVTSRRQSDRSFKIYARYVGDDQ